MRITVLSAIAFVVLYLVWSYFQKTTSDLTEKVLTVSTVTVKKYKLTQDLTVSAELVAFDRATLYAKVSGYLKTLNVDIGDQVKAGQVLAILDVPELRDEVANRKALYEITKLDYDRIAEALKANPGLVAQDDVDKAKAKYEMAQAQYEHAKTLFNYSIITAPYDGVITKRFVDEGALIQIGTSSSTQAQPIVEVSDNAKLRLRFPVPESNVMQVNPGDVVDLTIQSTGEKMQGTIARIANKVDSDTRTMRTEVDVDNRSLRMKPGMYATVTIHLGQKIKSLVVPTQAIELGNNPFVWLVNAHGKVEKRHVTLGTQTAALISITSGVKEGDKVVYGNHDKMEDGLRVKAKLIEAPNGTESDK